MDGGHQAFDHAEVVIQNLGDRGEAVGGAGSVGDDVHLLGEALVVDAHHEHRSSILARSGHHNLLGAGLKMGFGLVGGKEQTGGFDHIVGADFAPLQHGGILFSGHTDLLAVDDQLLIGSNFDGALEGAVHGVILQHVGNVIHIEQVVDRNHFHVLATLGGTEDQTADASETIDTNLNHFLFPHILACAGL
ncbi:hypothetical protein SDC9_171300 [bioreactor metagenome]|uniref:NAD-specific glutamate dehydrogenase n=1 Tax=bioreactor metagenome TaxID=1076179 RepID=A0A645GAG5_9ZZZZ